MKLKTLLLILIAATCAATMHTAAQNPKREFRGVWLPTVGDRYYQNHTTAENKAYLLNILDSAQLTHCNAIIFHCRPQADAFYPSKLEPWSLWLSGKAGQAPDPYWDPMEFMVTEAHKRGLELHAWINPYRVGSESQICDSALLRKHPEWFLKYGKQYYFDPAYPECRDFINRVVADIVTRYDIDGLHMDDYFYPYPIKDIDFPDTTSYARYGNGQDKGDWRRANVDSLIASMHRTIASIKPWVRFGISPFGIWRNKKTDPKGSDTNGLQCYDALYADCPKWTRMGWVDYMVPQLYWQMEHKAASDSVLMDWWNDNANGRDMYYGLAIRNTMNYANTHDSNIPTQLGQKLDKMRSLAHVGGVVWWPCYDLTGNYKGVADSLMARQQSTLALPPMYPWLDNKAPGDVVKLKKKHNTLTWQAPAASDEMQRAVKYVVYRFKKGEKIDTSRAEAIVQISDQASYVETAKGKFTYIVTAVDHCNNESRGVKK